jgi:hypothetical protein
VAGRLQREFGATIVVTGSAADRSLTEALVRELPVPPVDTTAMEIRYLESTLGPMRAMVLTQLGMSALKTRADLQRLAVGLQALGV